jgi:hypothetical protein
VGEITLRPKHLVLYTAKPLILTITPVTAKICPTTHRPWWTIPEAERLQMHAFTRPSQQLRLKVRHALLRSLHHTSLYRRLVVANKELGARLHTVGQPIHKRLNSVPNEGITLFKFMHGQLYNGKLAKRYGHAPKDKCPLCHKPDSCTHIARECKDHDALRISRHNATSQLVHATIRKTSKGGRALHTTPDLVLIAIDTSIQSQTANESLDLLSPYLGSPSSNEESESHPRATTPHSDWLEPNPNPNRVHNTRHTDVSRDPRYKPESLSAIDGDSLCTAAPRRIPDWVLSREEI